jgi:hypothetical protein
MNKQNYDPKKARFELAESNIMKINTLLWDVQVARTSEINYAPNETIDTADFDNLKIKIEELLQAFIKLGIDNMQ